MNHQRAADNVSDSIEPDEMISVIYRTVTGVIADYISNLTNFSFLPVPVFFACVCVERIPMTASVSFATSGLGITQSVNVPSVNSLA